MEKVTLEGLLTKDLRGKVVCFPTDTVYGVGALVDDIEAIERIFAMKKRDALKPLAILTATKDIESYVEKVNKAAHQLIDEKWPGAMTLIFRKKDTISEVITKGFSTIAFRMPNSPIALKILSHFGLMATTSVNISGEKELNNVDEISAKFKDYIDYIVTDTEKFSATPSTVIDVTTEDIKIIRK